MKVKIVNHSPHPLPSYATVGSSGLDMRAWLSEPLTLEPLDRVLVPTGIHIALPLGYEAQVRPRSGLSYKRGLSLPNTPATIDSDYRGELKIILINLSKEAQTIKDGERIAQLVIAKYERIDWEEIDEGEELGETERGAGGFGHSGTH